MKRWLVVVVAVLAALSAFAAIRSHIEPEARKKREVVYEAALRSYAQSFKLGQTRKDVEAHLRAKGTLFTQMCCIKETSAYADLVKIGEEEPRWYCGAHWVHAAFEYAAVERHDANRKAHDTDVLKTITIYHEGGACL